MNIVVTGRDWKSRSSLVCGDWFIAFIVRSAETFIQDKWKWVLQQIWPDVWSCERQNIIHRGTFILGLALCPAQLSKAHALFSDSEPRLSSEELLAMSHQPLSSSLYLFCLWKQKVPERRGSNWPIFMCQVGTQRESLGWCVWIFLGHVNCSVPAENSFWGKSFTPHISVSSLYLKGLMEDKNK